MPTLDERIAKEVEKLEQLKRQKRAHEAREKKKERAADTRQKIVAGAILLDIFPEYKNLVPQRNNADNNKEFEPLARFLSALAVRKDLVAQLQAEAQRVMAEQAADTPQGTVNPPPIE